MKPAFGVLETQFRDMMEKSGISLNLISEEQAIDMRRAFMGGAAVMLRELHDGVPVLTLHTELQQFAEGGFVGPRS